MLASTKGADSMPTVAVVPLLRRHWFLVLVPLMVLASFGLAASIDWQRDGHLVEMALLFDACISLPALYFLCYRGTMSARQMALRLIGLACLGIWFATWLVPASAQSVLPQLGWARMAGIVLLAVVELRLIVTALRMAFSGTATAVQVAEASGAPPWIARLMLLEARFWQRVWRLIRGR